MNILAPVNSAREAEILVRLGAQELYCGLNPEVCCGSKSQGVWLNRREPGRANLKSVAELEELVTVAHSGGAKVFLTLNQPGYDPGVFPDILRMVEHIQERCGVDAYIVADPGLMCLLKEALPDIVLHVSSLAAVLNSAAVSFFSQLGARRIVFPRYVPLETMRAIIAHSPQGLEFEAFIFNDGCVFEEGYCFVSHGFGGAFCHNPLWRYRLQVIQSGELKNTGIAKKTLGAGKESFEQHIDEYKRWLWVGIKNFGGMPGLKGYPLGMCGLCALPLLKEMGVNSLKIVGREAPLMKKAESVKLVKKIVDYLEEGHSQEEVVKLAQSMRGAKGLCASGYMCYYR